MPITPAPAFQYVQRWASLVPKIPGAGEGLAGLLEERDLDLEHHLSHAVEVLITGISPGTYGPYVPMVRDMILTKVIFRLATPGTTNTLSSLYINGSLRLGNAPLGSGQTEDIYAYDDQIVAGTGSVQVVWETRGTGALGWSAMLVMRPAGEILSS